MDEFEWKSHAHDIAQADGHGNTKNNDTKRHLRGRRVGGESVRLLINEGAEKLLAFAKKAKTLLMIYLATAGLVSFSLFILEEALQTAMFSTWAAKDAKDWQLVLEANRFFKETNRSMLKINKYFGWINPFSYMAYDAYGAATQHIILSNESQIACFAPELLIQGQDVVTLNLKIRSKGYDSVSGVAMVDFNQFCLYASTPLVPGDLFRFTGILTDKKNSYNQIILEEKIEEN